VDARCWSSRFASAILVPAHILSNHMYRIETPSGTAYVWAAGIAALNGAGSNELNATTYAGHFHWTVLDRGMRRLRRSLRRG
jgi:hypothetical protein